MSYGISHLINDTYQVDDFENDSVPFQGTMEECEEWLAKQDPEVWGE